MSKPLLSIVLPILNEEESIPKLLERLISLMENVEHAQLEVIFVDDHSTDETPTLLKTACFQHPGMRYYRLSSNKGSHIAILAGLKRARGACAIFMAADLQDPPEMITGMLSLWKEGNHVIWAVRERREGVPYFERLMAIFFYWLMNRFGNVVFPPTGSDFALLDRAVIDALLASVGANPSIGGEIARLGFRQAKVPYVKESRRYGHSKWTFAMKLKTFIDSMVAFSYVPMRVMIYLGLSFSAIALLYATIVVILRLTAEHTITGWASTMIILLVLGGLQMTMLGLLGEYLWRNLEESRRRPIYFIEDEVD